MNKIRMKKEAISRLRKFAVLDAVINNFEDGKVMVSERLSDVFTGILYDSENYEGLNEAIHRAEEDYNIMVYHVVLTHMVFGDMYAMLYVPAEEEQWEQDHADIDDNYAYAYVWVKPDEVLSEIGTVGVKPANGGIDRWA